MGLRAPTNFGPFITLLYYLWFYQASIASNIYSLRRCRWTPHLPHLTKYWGTYGCWNLGSPRCHSEVTVVPGHCPTQIAISPSSQLWLKVFLDILESRCHKLPNAHGLTLVTLSLCGWTVFPMLAALTHSRIIIWALPPMAVQVLGVTSGSSLSMVI